MAMRRPIVNGQKNCSKCEQFKSLTEFGQYLSGPQVGIHYSICKPCRREEGRKWREGKDNMRNARLKYTFGITVETYEEMADIQDRLCAICKQPGARTHLDIDHCHKTNEIRGLLCPNCNKGLGLFKDNPQLLTEALNYLRRTNV